MPICTILDDVEVKVNFLWFHSFIPPFIKQKSSLVITWLLMHQECGMDNLMRFVLSPVLTPSGRNLSLASS